MFADPAVASPFVLHGVEKENSLPPRYFGIAPETSGRTANSRGMLLDPSLLRHTGQDDKIATVEGGTPDLGMRLRKKVSAHILRL